MDQGSNKNHSPAYNFAPTVTKFCVMWEGQALPHDTKFGNCRCKIVDSRAFPSWSLIHGLRWSGLIKAEPGLTTWCIVFSRVVFVNAELSFTRATCSWPFGLFIYYVKILFDNHLGNLVLSIWLLPIFIFILAFSPVSIHTVQWFQHPQNLIKILHKLRCRAFWLSGLFRLRPKWPLDCSSSLHKIFDIKYYHMLHLTISPRFEHSNGITVTS